MLRNWPLMSLFSFDLQLYLNTAVLWTDKVPPHLISTLNVKNGPCCAPYVRILWIHFVMTTPDSLHHILPVSCSLSERAVAWEAVASLQASLIYPGTWGFCKKDTAHIMSAPCRLLSLCNPGGFSRLPRERRGEPEGGRKRWGLREREKGKPCCLLGFLLC